MYVLITSESLRVNINLTTFASLFTLQALNQMKLYTMHCYLCMFKTVTSSIPLKFLKRWSWEMLIPTGWVFEIRILSSLNYWWASKFWMDMTILGMVFFSSFLSGNPAIAYARICRKRRCRRHLVSTLLCQEYAWA